MKDIKDLVAEFSSRAVNHHRFSLEGDYKNGNSEIKKINKIFESIKAQKGMNDLLQLIYSDIPEVASLSAAYCMRYSPNKCLSVFEKLSKDNIPLISFEAKYAIQNWNNNQWYID